MVDDGQEQRQLKFGCKHYDRGCEIFADCCSKWYSCRLCHNMEENHEIDRFKIRTMKCLACSTEQPVAKHCISCTATVAEYFCQTCNLFDNKPLEKKIFHCDDCGICRVGGRDEYFHCSKCGACYSNDLKDAHKCVENSLQQDCAICLEYMFESRENISVLKCGHAFHRRCVNRALKSTIGCPICRTSMVDLTQEFARLRQRILDNPVVVDENTTTPVQMVAVHCNDCQAKTTVQFHPFGLECQQCSSFNTVIDEVVRNDENNTGSSNTGN